MKNVCILGGGPAGMMAAVAAKTHHPQVEVIIIEGNSELGKKLKLTGGGRCNVTADVSNEEVVQSVVKNGKFLYSALTQCNPQTIQAFFRDLGCPLKVEDHHRVFPQSDDANDIIKALKTKLQQLNITILYNIKVSNIDFENKTIHSNKPNIHFDKLILATGGRTYMETGSDGSGYDFAKQAGHTITPLLPAEVPLVSNDSWIQDKSLQGLSFQDVELSIMRKGKIKHRITHDLIITHFGISGPAALRASFYVQKELKKEPLVDLCIDFLPSLSIDTLKQEVQNQTIDDVLLAYAIPKRLIQYLKKVESNHLEAIQLLKRFPIHIYTTRGFSNAFVTNGGVNLKEVDPKTMKSKRCDCLSLCGEVLDISAFTGGFNITAAFASGYVAGKYVIND